jgi:uncharacterized protein
MGRRRYCLRNLISAYDDSRSPRQLLAAELRLPEAEITAIEILRKSLDARQKPQLKAIWTLAFDLDEALAAHRRSRIEEHADPELPPLPALDCSRGRPLVVGAGPAGQFAALGLAARGWRPIVLERGFGIARRRLDVRRLWLQRELDPDSNVQFGEGGAGTFSDGKLTSRNSSWFTRQVLRWMVDLGADPEVIYSHLPHVGTDGIRRVSTRLREQLEAAGVEFRFGARVEELLVGDGAITGLRLAGGELLESSAVLLAPGHSARDTLEGLARLGVALEAKPFAMGLRIEHPREFIDRTQYGTGCNLAIAGTATYKLAAKLDSGRSGPYSFCMCPGGMVVLAASEAGRLVVNGMSWSSRRMRWSNSALVAGLPVEELLRWSSAAGIPAGPLAGFGLQRRIEELAFREGDGDWSAPAQRAVDFLEGRVSTSLPAASYRPALRSAALDRHLPEPLCAALREGLRVFDRRMRGFIAEGLLISPETRTSSPVRIPRNPELRCSLSHGGLYPLGEGAGYAGGIVSSAADGLRTGLSFRQNGPPRIGKDPVEAWR